MPANIDAFLATKRIAVVGASANPDKYGHKVFQHLRSHGFDVIPVNPTTSAIDGVSTATDLYAIEPLPEAVSIITPPQVSEKVIADALTLSIKHIWLQPGAENGRCLQLCVDAGVDVIAGGPCVLLELP